MKALKTKPGFITEGKDYLIEPVDPFEAPEDTNIFCLTYYIGTDDGYCYCIQEHSVIEYFGRLPDSGYLIN